MTRAPSRIRSDHPGSRQLAGDTTSATATEPHTTRVTESTDPDPLRTLRPRQTIYYQTLTDVLSRYYHLSIIAAQGVLRRWVHPRWSGLQPALLRCARLGQARSLIPVGQIAKVSSSKAARTRRFTVSSTPSS
jgi:hypothetical protein